MNYKRTYHYRQHWHRPSSFKHIEQHWKRNRKLRKQWNLDVKKLDPPKYETVQFSCVKVR